MLLTSDIAAVSSGPVQVKAMPEYQTDEACWEAVVRRDPDADGRFYYAVRTTGVYCRPSCPSKGPRRENVAFYRTGEEAQRSGFRPCKRCRPNESVHKSKLSVAIENACRALDTAEVMPNLSELAAMAGLSPFHFHRMFRSEMGMTPKAYFAERRASRMREQLQESGTVTEAVYAAGFSSSSRFYERSAEILGMSPKVYQSGGAGASIRFAVGECSLGSLLVAATEKGVCAIFLGDDPQQLICDLQDRFLQATLVGADEEFEQWVAKVVALVEVPGAGLDLPLDVRGTAFQQRVWQALRNIPLGSTTTYAKLAVAMGAPKAVRAVARACATNPLAIAIPCHRVVRTDGGLSGYRWGIERKRQLLEREAAG
ncbi:MAG TPA: bifunctional DNA-binding transcriptional regulator/O6-methylguanine-DNA methyltransferase Ada [Bryobacteraceae bacterium]|nr:bifunctional DNA-binding transcriptional regulator/O6-methylguanine-DNA methyltransferase Ada [Bryobacteraceae bacterium]